MKFSGETLMAYADGELDAQTCREIEAALPIDPVLAHQVARQRALQSTLRATFAPALDTAVPQRLIDAARGAARNRSGAAANAPAMTPLRKLLGWQLPASVAGLAVLAAVCVGRLLGAPATPALTLLDGRMLAQGVLATALSTQTGGAEPWQSAVVIGLSYLAKSGSYCRTFTVKQSDSIAGVACREADGWHIQALARSGPKSPLVQYRMAGIPVPPLILGIVESTIDGSPLDARSESAAREGGWQR